MGSAHSLVRIGEGQRSDRMFVGLWELMGEKESIISWIEQIQ